MVIKTLKNFEAEVVNRDEIVNIVNEIIFN